MVERDRLEEDHDPPVLERHPDATAEHAGRVLRTGRNGQDHAGDVAQSTDRVVVVEVAAEALLVGEARDADDHRIAELAAAEDWSVAASPRIWSSALWM